jgi:predicted RNase H-like HicB family nuclease
MTGANQMKIVTHYICPPIPTRSHDWVAFEDGREEDGIYGYGKTEEEAVEDLKEMTNDF